MLDDFKLKNSTLEELAVDVRIDLPIRGDRPRSDGGEFYAGFSKVSSLFILID